MTTNLYFKLESILLSDTSLATVICLKVFLGIDNDPGITTTYLKARFKLVSYMLKSRKLTANEQNTKNGHPSLCNGGRVGKVAEFQCS